MSIITSVVIGKTILEKKGPQMLNFTKLCTLKHASVW